MSLRPLSLVFLAALLSLGVAAPQVAIAAPIDLDDEEDDEDDDDLELDESDLSRGGGRYDFDKKKKKDDDDDFLIEDDFDEPVEDFEGVEDDFPDDALPALGDFEGFEDEEPLGGVDRPRRGAERGPGPIHLDVAGKTPLGDNYPLAVVAVDRDAVVVELPVLLARSRVEVRDGFIMYAEVFVGDTRVTEVRQVVEKASLAEFGPSFAFMKILAPVVEREGQIKVKVFKANADGSGREEMFSRVTPYALQN